MSSHVRPWFGEETPLPDDGIVAGSAIDAPDLNVDSDVLLDGVGLPAFVLDEQSRVAAWNAGVESLTGMSAAGALDRCNLGETFYGDAAARVFMGQVLDSPRDAALFDDVELDDPDRLLYATGEAFAGVNGDDCHIQHTVMPLYEGDELVGVLQTIRNRTTEVKRHHEVAALVPEAESTLTQLGQGNLDARATIDDSGAIDGQLYLVADAANETVRNLPTLVSNVEGETETATAAVMRAVSAIDAIVENVDEQRDLLDGGATQMQQFSATMERVVAIADEIDTAATEAWQATAGGHEANSETREATRSVVMMGDELIDRMTELGGRMDDIEAAVEVISEVAEQTDLLVLNASTEATRAGKDDDGFAVVAEGVKPFADETHQYTGDITAQIENIQSQTDEAVHAATGSNGRTEHVDKRIFEMLVAFEEIAASIDTAADGVAEAFRATDEQVEAVEELTAITEDVCDRIVETEGVADNIAAVTGESAQALSPLATEIEELIGGRSA